MKQVLIFHGGHSFSTPEEYLQDIKSVQIEYERLKYSKKWSGWIAENLPGHDVLTPTFPNGSNAQYDEWVIYFEKIVPFLKDEFYLIGHSLGAMFLAKYLHTNVLPVKARQIILIAPRYGESPDESSGSFLVESAEGFDRSAHEVHLFHSKDDAVVDYESMSLFAADIPTAIVHSFDGRGHFNGPTFPEILELVK